MHNKTERKSAIKVVADEGKGWKEQRPFGCVVQLNGIWNRPVDMFSVSLSVVEDNSKECVGRRSKGDTYWQNPCFWAIFSWQNLVLWWFFFFHLWFLKIHSKSFLGIFPWQLVSFSVPYPGKGGFLIKINNLESFGPFEKFGEPPWLQLWPRFSEKLSGWDRILFSHLHFQSCWCPYRYL